MAFTKLRIFLKGREIETFSLNDLSEFTIGRSSQCNYVLKQGKKISRKHIRLYKEEDTNVWVAENLSRFKHFFVKSKTVDKLVLKNGSKFSCPPYEFLYEETQQEKNKEDSKFLESSSDDDTITSFSQIQGFLEAYHQEKGFKSFSLSQTNVTFGKGKNCDEILEESSQEQAFFEIFKSTDGFFIEPLQASVKIKKNTLTSRQRLNSGDLFECEGWSFTFLEKNKAIEEKINKFPSLSSASHSYASSQPLSVIVETKKSFFKSPRLKKLMGASLVLIVMLAFFSGHKNPKKIEKKPVSPYDQLTETEKIQIEHSFELARKQSDKMKYTLCLEELKVIHSFLSSYKDSQELKAKCKIGLEQERRYKRLAQLEEQERRTKQKVKEKVLVCKKKSLTFRSVEELKECLGESINLYPGFEDMQQLEMNVKVRLRNEEERKEQNAIYREKVEKGVQHYQKAISFKEKTPLKTRMSYLKAYINTPYPDPNHLKAKARRNLASLEKDFHRKINAHLNQCKTAFEKKYYKQAYSSCNLALKEDLSHQEAKNLKRKIINEKDQKMRHYYNQATLEEGFRNIYTARKYWQRILKEDVEDGTYYQKAKRKLDQYGDL